MKVFILMLIFSLNIIAAEECSSDNKNSIPSCMKKCEVDSDCSLVSKECYNFPVNNKYKEDAYKIVNSLKLNQCIDTIPADCKFVKCISKQCIFFQQDCVGRLKNKTQENAGNPVPGKHTTNNIIISKVVTPIPVDDSGMRINIRNESGLKRILSHYVDLLSSNNIKSLSLEIFKNKLINEKEYLILLINSNLNDKDIITKISIDKKDNMYLQAHLSITLRGMMQFNQFYSEEDFKEILIKSFVGFEAKELISIIDTLKNKNNNRTSMGDVKGPDVDLEKIKFKNKDSKIMAFIILKSFIPQNYQYSTKVSLTSEEEKEYVFYFNDILTNSNPIYRNLLKQFAFELNAFASLNYLAEKGLIDLLEIWKNSRDLFGLTFARANYNYGKVKNEYILKYILNNIDKFIMSAKSEKEVCNLLMVIQYDFYKYLNKQNVEKLTKMQPYKYKCMNIFSKIQEFKKVFKVANCNLEIYAKNQYVGSNYTEIPIENCSRRCESSLDCSNLIHNTCLNIPVNKKYAKEFNGQREIIMDNGLCTSLTDDNHIYECKENVCITNEEVNSKYLIKFLKDNELINLATRKEILACEFNVECRDISISKNGANEKITISSGVASDDYYFDLVKRFEENGIQVNINSIGESNSVGQCNEGLCKIKVP